VINAVLHRVNYSETDQMGFVYHANYLIWMDMARTEHLRERGMSYKDLEEQGTYPGVLEFHGTTTVDALFRRFHSTQIPRPETKFAGDNNTGWNEPRADRLLEELQRTLEADARRSLVAQFGTLVSQELPTLPLYYVAEPVAVAKGLQAARPRPMGSNQYNTTWNAFMWEWA